MNSMVQRNNSRNSKVTLKCSLTASLNNQIQENVWIKRVNRLWTSKVYLALNKSLSYLQTWKREILRNKNLSNQFRVERKEKGKKGVEIIIWKIV